MKAGYLSQFFSGIAIKRLSAVEADGSRSHQHEFNGDTGLKQVFGPTKNKYPARFIYLSDNDEEPVVADGPLTWYDSRERHPTRSEYRLYFPTTSVSLCAAEGDLLVIGRRPDDSVLVIIVQGDSTISNQVLWLFRVSLSSYPGFSVREELESEQDRIQFASRCILEQIGIPVETTAEDYLDKLTQRFGLTFPTTREFSAFSRTTLPDLAPNEDPDSVLMAWMEREEILFRTLEKHIIAERLTEGFRGDVEGFLEFSLSVQNRRKSRVGFALENHLEAIFIESGIRHRRGAVTEGKSKPDFLFPGTAEYHNPTVDSELLTVLGAKSTCKDRWRQVLSEAARIKDKHLLTLEAAISSSQTSEMKYQQLQLVVPRGLHGTYDQSQQSWLLDLSDFMSIVREREKRLRH